jgi:hypothetical protein
MKTCRVPASGDNVIRCGIFPAFGTADAFKKGETCNFFLIVWLTDQEAKAIKTPTLTRELITQ